MSHALRPIRLTTYLSCKGGAAAIDFYANAFGATERYRLPCPDGRLGHAEIAIGETTLMTSDEWPGYVPISPTTLGGATAALVLDVPDCKIAFERAVACGARIDRPITESPPGRGGWLIDPFGHRWNIMTSSPGFEPASLP